MNLKQKILSMVGLISLLAVGSLLFSQKAFALDSGDFKSPPAEYVLVGTSRMEVTVPDGATFGFVSDNPIADPLVFKPNPQNQGGVHFCDGSTITISNTGGVPGSSAKVNLRWNDSGTSCSVLLTKTFSGTVGFENGVGGGGESDTCEGNSTTGLEWIMCPVFSFISDATNRLINLFEDNLCFKSSVATTGAGSSCEPFNADSIKPAWSAIKNIISALLVVIMLVAIISEAASIGPIDAYAIRKMLPKIVLAVILIQLSFYLFSFAINVVNDVGQGMGNLLNNAFSRNNFNINDLGDLLKHAGVTVGTSGAILGVGLIGAIAFGIAALPTLLMLIFVAFLSILVGLAVLIFRKVLIIGLLLISPVALLLWILPSTEYLWKKYWDTFIKVLLMFPIIVLIIEAGRIFAFVAGPASDSAFIKFFLVMIGFFGPLFILPKAFQWGGGLMQAAGNAAFKGSGKLSEKPVGYFKGRQEGWRDERLRRSQERYRREEGFNWRRPWQRPVDLARAGQLDPFLAMQGRTREIAGISYAAAGAESERKELEAANTAAQLVIERTHPDDQDPYARALAAGQKVKVDQNGRIMARRNADGSLDIDDRTGRIMGAADETNASLLETRAGLDQITRLGGERNIQYVQSAFERAMNSGDARQIEMMNKFTTANVQSLFSKLPHLYKNNNYAVPGSDHHDVVRTVDGLNPADITNLSGVAMRTLRDNLVTRASDTSLSADQRSASVEGLQRLTATFQQAASDPTLRGRIPAEVAKSMHELASRKDSIPDTWGVRPVLNDIEFRVDSSGIVREPSTAAPPPPPGSGRTTDRV